MKIAGKQKWARTLAASLFLLPTILIAQTRAIDKQHSTITVKVFKSGLFSGFAHNHEIAAPIEEGVVDVPQQRVSLRADTRKMRVLDPEASENTRAEIQKTMLGADVLNRERFPEISFESTSVERSGDDQWTVHGNLTLHGQTNRVTVNVRLSGEHYRGTATLKQHDFGIAPISIAGGTVKVKDEVKIEFDIALAR